ncbi:hypothetical protein DFH09DRAFT_1086076 [Mycena vulgaris]|nr:hypothetical protein DFH09DRAFT_1086076 [Mycena vulgaris]
MFLCALLPSATASLMSLPALAQPQHYPIECPAPTCSVSSADPARGWSIPKLVAYLLIIRHHRSGGFNEGSEVLVPAQGRIQRRFQAGGGCVMPRDRPSGSLSIGVVGVE